MENFTENLNFLVSLGTVVGQFFLLVVLILWLIVRFAKSGSLKARSNIILEKLGSHGIVVGFIVVLLSIIISLLYSDVIGYEPCKLCWIQRIFLYPQAIILGLALWKKTKDAPIYCLALSSIGAIVAGYHFYGQSLNPNALPVCDAVGGVSCAVRFFVEFGYVTLPMMSFTAFLLVLTFTLLANRSRIKQ